MIIIQAAIPAYGKIIQILFPGSEQSMVSIDPKKAEVIFQKSMGSRQVIMCIHRERNELPHMILIISVPVGRYPEAIILRPIKIPGIYMRQDSPLPDTILNYIIIVDPIPGGYQKYRWRYIHDRFNIMVDERRMALEDILQLSTLDLQQGSKRADPDSMPGIFNDTADIGIQLETIHGQFPGKITIINMQLLILTYPDGPVSCLINTISVGPQIVPE